MAIALMWLVLAYPAAARVAGIEDGTGAGFLFRNGGNCYVILPTHVHGALRHGVRIGSAASGGAIGTAKIVYVVPGDADISLGLVRGGIARECGPAWPSLPRRLNDVLEPGTRAILRRPRQSSVEGRQLLVHSYNFQAVRLVPAPGEAADLFGGTSGAVAFLGEVPIGMVLEAEDTGAAWALRMDEIVALLSRFVGDGKGSAAPSGEAEPVPLALPPGDALEATDWSAHPIADAADPPAMIAGQGPWIFALDNAPVSLTLRLKETDRISRIRMLSSEVPGAFVPRKVTISTDNSNDPARPRAQPLPAPEMTPDGVFDLRFGERFAHTVTLTFHSSWQGGSPVRLDAVTID